VTVSLFLLFYILQISFNIFYFNFLPSLAPPPPPRPSQLTTHTRLSQRHGAAIALFDVLLAHYPTLIACYMAKGSACAMTGNYEEAVKCFTQALAEDPTMFDAWKRRGQTQAARGVEFLPAALADLDQVLFVIFICLFISLSLSLPPPPPRCRKFAYCDIIRISQLFNPPLIVFPFTACTRVFLIPPCFL
jgi:tetratricopeptide (TPR) repeat protein